MTFRKPFRAVPVKLGPRYRRLQRGEERASALKVLGLAAVLGAVGGVAMTDNGRAGISRGARTFAIEFGWMRARAPEAGDSWRGCDQARAAGTAPIYRGEPGYREEMDGDGDGIACEPYRG